MADLSEQQDLCGYCGVVNGHNRVCITLEVERLRREVAQREAERDEARADLDQEHQLIARENEMADLVTAATDRGLALEVERDIANRALEIENEKKQDLFAALATERATSERLREALESAHVGFALVRGFVNTADPNFGEQARVITILDKNLASVDAALAAQPDAGVGE